MTDLEIPSAERWTRRWWRVPGDSFLSQQIRNVAVNATFAWCREGEWGVALDLPNGTRELVFFADGNLAGTSEVAGDIVQILNEQLRVRMSRILPAAAKTPPIVAAIAAHWPRKSWLSGKKLRRDTGLDFDAFPQALKSLLPRYVRMSSIDEADEYSLTLPGMLLAGELLKASSVMESIYRAVAHRVSQDPEAEVFDRADLAAVGAGDLDVDMVRAVGEAALLIEPSPDDRPHVFRLPPDGEAIFSAAKKKMPFSQYLLHAATEARNSDHYPVRRPWRTAPLWIGRDGSQPDWLPASILWKSFRNTGSTPPDAGGDDAKEDSAKDDTRPDIPGYVVVASIGDGAGGEVYRAKENRPGGVERAIKVFTPHPFADDQDPEPRFRSEVEALYRLQHRAIVRYVSSGVVPGLRSRFYLVMELVEGTRLQTRVAEMAFPERVAALIEILDGLEYAHRNRIFHRDLKPSNIMIRTSDQQPVLVDFGLAYLVGDELDDDRTRHVLGTPGYIAPEAANDPKRSRDPRYDVYAAGVILYEVLFGRRPNESYVPLASIDERLRSLDPIVQRAIAADPTQRTPSAEALASDLREWSARDARVAVLPRSRATSRLRESLAAKLRQETLAAEEQKLREELRRETLAPLAELIETAGMDAFSEVHADLADLAPDMQLTMQERRLLVPPEDESAGILSSPLCALTRARTDRAINLSRAHRSQDLWNSAVAQLPGIDAVAKQAKAMSPVWVVWVSGKLQSPSQIVLAAIAVEWAGDPREPAVLVAFGRMGRSVLQGPVAIKTRVVEAVGEALGAH